MTQQIGDSWQQTRNKPATSQQQIHNNSVIRYKNGRNWIRVVLLNSDNKKLVKSREINYLFCKNKSTSNGKAQKDKNHTKFFGILRIIRKTNLFHKTLAQAAPIYC